MKYQINIILINVLLLSVIYGCIPLQIKKYNNIQRHKHIVKKSYDNDTLYFNKVLFWSIGYDGGQKFYDRGDFFNDTIINFDALTQYLFSSISSLDLPINKRAKIQNKAFEKITTDRSKYKYNFISDETIISIADSTKNKLYIVPVIKSHSRIHRGDYGIQQTVDLFIKICIIKNKKIIYSKYFMTFNNSDIFTLEDSQDYESTRAFFELNNHTPKYTQEDWNRIMAFALKGYLKRLND